MLGTNKDFGLLTTPQLHYMVACYNNGQYDVCEEDYYKDFSAAFKSLIKNVSMSSMCNCINKLQNCTYAIQLYYKNNIIIAKVITNSNTGREGNQNMHVEVDLKA